MHSPSLWYETEVRNFLMIIFLTNIEILYLECVSTNDYMLILHCLVLFGPTLLFLSFSFYPICCNCIMGQKHTLSDIPKPPGQVDCDFSLAEKMRVSKEQMMEIHVSPIQGLLSVLTSLPYQ